MHVKTRLMNEFLLQSKKFVTKMHYNTWFNLM